MDRSFEGLRVWQQSRTFVNIDRKMINQETFNKLKSEAISISNQIYRLIESISQGQRDSVKGQK
jgi:hypothetical protein